MSDTEQQQWKAAIKDRDLLGVQSFKQTHLYTSFAAIKASLRRYFKIKDLPFVHNNDVKQILRQSMKPEYPYAYVSMTSIAKTESSMNSPVLRRRGQGYVGNTANASLVKLHYFPITLRYEFHYVTNDYRDAIRFIGEALILFDAKVLNVRIRSGNASSFVTIKLDSPEIQIPRADKDNEAEPEAFDLVMTCTSDTHTGTEKQISKVNNAGTVVFHGVVVNNDGEVVDEEETEIHSADDVE